MNYKFTDIAGYPQEKAELQRLCDIINDREQYLARGAKLPKGVIFYGGTGTGKTLFAKVMASTCNLKMIEIDLGSPSGGNALLKKMAIGRYDDDYDAEDGADYDAEDGADFDDTDRDDDDNDDDERSVYYTKADYLNAICALMGGYVAEEVVLHKTYDNIYPLLMTTDYVLAGISEAGLLGLGLRYSEIRNGTLKYPQERVSEINAAFDEIVDGCCKRARAIIEANAELIRKLIPILVEQRSIFKPACEKILGELGGIQKTS